ncbi:MAG TPA: right-handed parallel beta-helix repeat-containing protein [Prolixibacteraceae bacterium]|nr:right-handed parallel beta-helix repeat-containing protein [Prolixibacteraceae bacterium]
MMALSAEGKNIEFYVSPAGNDMNPGTKTAPFKSLGKAKESVRTQLKKSPGKSVVVSIKGGSYFLEAPVVFTTEDCGAGDVSVVYQAVEGEEPVFTGSRELKKWQLAENPDKLELLAPEVKGKIYVTDVKSAGIADYGDPTELGKSPVLYCNKEMQTLARWPDNGFTRAGVAKGKTVLPLTYTKDPGTKEGIFEYTGQRQNRWAKESDVRLEGYWYWDWSDEFQKVDRVDTGSHLLYLKEPFHNYGYKDSLRYFGLNLFCELDQPGEWYLDRTDGLLYWYPPKEVNPVNAKVTLSEFGFPHMVEMKNCSNMTLQGLTFEEGRGSAILVSGGKNCLISGCRIERFGKDGIHVEEGSGHGISGCLLRTFGCGGIKMTGGERKTLRPAGHFVEQTVVEYFSLFKRTYEPAIHLTGCGIRISNNRFRYSSSSAMRLEGNDFTIEYNEVSHVVNESDDQGGIDMFYNPSYRGTVIRFNHWTDISGGTRHGAAGVRLDDMICGVQIYGNLFERCGALHFGGVQIHGGKDNTVENNLFYKCFAGVSFSSWGEKRWLEQLDSPVIQKKIFEEVDIRSELYQSRYPELKDIRLNADRNTIKNNLMVDCTNPFLREKKSQIFENNTSAQSDGKTPEEFCAAKILKNYGMQSIPYQEMGPVKNKWIQ